MKNKSKKEEFKKIGQLESFGTFVLADARHLAWHWNKGGDWTYESVRDNKEDNKINLFKGPNEEPVCHAVSGHIKKGIHAVYARKDDEGNVVELRITFE